MNQGIDVIRAGAYMLIGFFICLYIYEPLDTKILVNNTNLDYKGQRVSNWILKNTYPQNTFIAQGDMSMVPALLARKNLILTFPLKQQIEWLQVVHSVTNDRVISQFADYRIVAKTDSRLAGGGQVDVRVQTDLPFEDDWYQIVTYTTR